MAHTPGPWHFSEMVSAAVVIGNEVVKLGCGEESKATARLIAAAPDLLEALQSIAECCEEDQTARDYASRQTEIRGIARAAIAKATGEQ